MQKNSFAALVTLENDSTCDDDYCPSKRKHKPKIQRPYKAEDDMKAHESVDENLYWKCSRCTFVNNDFAALCAMCSAQPSPWSSSLSSLSSCNCATTNHQDDNDESSHELSASASPYSPELVKRNGVHSDQELCMDKTVEILSRDADTSLLSSSRSEQVALEAEDDAECIHVTSDDNTMSSQDADTHHVGVCDEDKNNVTHVNHLDESMTSLSISQTQSSHHQPASLSMISPLKHAVTVSSHFTPRTTSHDNVNSTSSTPLSSALARDNMEHAEHKRYMYGFRVRLCRTYLEKQCFADSHMCFDCHDKQPRRVPYKLANGEYAYAPTRCRYMQTSHGKRRCPQSDSCRYAHSTEEMIYHPLVYKTQLCPYMLNDENICTGFGVHCAKAHGIMDQRHPTPCFTGSKIGIVHSSANLSADTSSSSSMNGESSWMQRNIPQNMSKNGGISCALSSVAECNTELNVGETDFAIERDDPAFFMLYYKTERCPHKSCPRTCERYHNLKERRRSPRLYSYSEQPCPYVKSSSAPKNWRDPARCPNGDRCHHAHTLLEQMYHPRIYKTSLCNNFTDNEHSRCAWGALCTHAHGVADMKRQARALATHESFLAQHVQHEQCSSMSSASFVPSSGFDQTSTVLASGSSLLVPAATNALRDSTSPSRACGSNKHCLPSHDNSTPPSSSSQSISPAPSSQSSHFINTTTSVLADMSSSTPIRSVVSRLDCSPTPSRREDDATSAITMSSVNTAVLSGGNESNHHRFTSLPSLCDHIDTVWHNTSNDAIWTPSSTKDSTYFARGSSSIVVTPHTCETNESVSPVTNTIAFGLWAPSASPDTASGGEWSKTTPALNGGVSNDAADGVSKWHEIRNSEQSLSSSRSPSPSSLPTETKFHDCIEKLELENARLLELVRVREQEVQSWRRECTRLTQTNACERCNSLSSTSSTKQ